MSNQSPATLAREVFDVVATRFRERARDIGWMTDTGNSFEVWCAWEAWLACTENADWAVWANPLYSKFVASKDMGDWLVDDRNGNKLFIELGIIHDGTGATKWSAKCDADRAKLCRIANQICGLHLILVTSRKHDDIGASEKWLARWSRLQCWAIETTLSVSAPLPDGGQMLLKGWLIEKPDENGSKRKSRP